MVRRMSSRKRNVLIGNIEKYGFESRPLTQLPQQPVGRAETGLVALVSEPSVTPSGPQPLSAHALTSRFTRYSRNSGLPCSVSPSLSIRPSWLACLLLLSRLLEFPWNKFPSPTSSLVKR